MPTPSRLAFGTSGIMGAALTDSGRIRLLEYALENGITHFDTAPLYGLGEAEKVLGKFTANKRSTVTIATKFGLTPRRVHPGLKPLLPIARVINRAVKEQQRRQFWRGEEITNHEKPKFKKRSDSEGFVGDLNAAKLTALNLQTELHNSLGKLRTEIVDLYLLHDVSLAQLSDELVTALEHAKRSGKIGEIGLAAPRTHIRKIWEKFPQLKSVTQVPASDFCVDEDELAESGTMMIQHSCMARPERWLYLWVQKNLAQLPFDLLQESSINTDDVGEIVAFLRVQRALLKLPSSTLLFSSANRAHISKNAIYASIRSDVSVELMQQIRTMLES